MKLKVLASVGRLTAETIVPIPNDQVEISQEVDAVGEASLRVDLSRIVHFPIPDKAEVFLQVKNNHLMTREGFRVGEGSWGEMKPKAANPFVVPVGKERSPLKTEIIVEFTKPGENKYVAHTGHIRLPDTQAEVMNGGQSYFRTRRNEKSKRPVMMIMEPDGPVFEFGPMGPKSGPMAETDFSFCAIAAIDGVEKAVTYMLFDEEDEKYHDGYWEGFRNKVVSLMGKKKFSDIRDMLQSSTVEEVALDCARAFFNDRNFYSHIRKLYQQQVEEPAIEQE